MISALLFILNSILLGAALAMDAFAVSLANGLAAPDLPRRRALAISSTFGLFQMVMPLAGWLCVRRLADAFASFRRLIPWIALILLALLGLRMIAEGVKERHGGSAKAALGGWTLFLQGIATSIDALSVGFAIAKYELPNAFFESLIIGLVTFAICLFGLKLGGRIGTRLAGGARIVGGIILILIGLEIFFF